MLEVPTDDSSTGELPVRGSIALAGGTLVLLGEVDTDLCWTFRAAGHDLASVRCVDTRQVTFFGSGGLSLLAEVARACGVVVPVLAGPAALRTLRMTGLDQLFDVRPAG